MKKEKLKKNGAGIIIYNDKNQVLLQLRNNDHSIKYPNNWVLFGGAMNPNEVPEQAVKREIYEEIGIILRNISFFRNYVYIDEDEVHKQYIFKLQSNLDLNKIILKEGADFKFFSKKELENIDIGFNVRDMLRDFFNTIENGKIRKSNQSVQEELSNS